jgi:hypothetical protein
VNNKNDLVKDFYKSHGFKLVEELEKGSLWELDLNEESIRAPEWVACRIAEGVTQ